MENLKEKGKKKYFEEVRHPHGQDDSFFQQPLGLGQVGDVVPVDVGVLLHDITLCRDHSNQSMSRLVS